MRDFSFCPWSNYLEYHPVVDMSHALPQSFTRLAWPSLMAALLLCAAPAWSQDEADEATDSGESVEGETAGAPEAGPGEADGEEAGDAEEGGGPAVGLDEIPELDDQTYEKDDDDFVPTEEIPVDQAIPFPTDI